MLLLVIASSYILVTNLNEAARRTADYNRTMQSLNLAKQALIGYAVTYYNSNSAGNFGILPCPDTTATGEEGNQDSPCGSRNVNSLGMLPWQSLGISPLKDGNGQCLWYAVSGAFKGGSTKAYMVNEDSRGTFRVIAADGSTVITGSTAQSRPVAVVFAPGRVLSYQNRTPAAGSNCGNDYTASAYLDAQVPSNPTSGIRNYSLSGTADDIDQFIQAGDPASEDFNDLMVFITADEIINAVKKRNDYAGKLYLYSAANNLTRLVAECLAQYAIARNSSHGRYILPWPAPLTLTDYRDSAEYSDYAYTSTTSNKILSGRVPVFINDSNNRARNTLDIEVSVASANNHNLIDDCTVVSGAAKTELKALWENWKDHLYYSLGEPFQPAGNNNTVCAQGARCITLNYSFASGTDRDFAGVVRFSHSALSTQARVTAGERSSIGNYLENITGTNNTDNYVDTAGDTTKRYDFDGTISTARNDIYYCINDNDGGALSAYDFDVCRCPTDSTTTFSAANAAAICPP